MIPLKVLSALKTVRNYNTFQLFQLITIKTMNSVYSDLIDCVSEPCHLAWLTREDSFLLNFVHFAKCSDGRELKALDKSHFANCSQVTINSNFK